MRVKVWKISDPISKSYTYNDVSLISLEEMTDGSLLFCLHLPKEQTCSFEYTEWQYVAVGKICR